MTIGKGYAGRKESWTFGGVSSIAFQSKSISVNNEMIDVTNDTSDGWATKLAEPGTKSVEITGGGIVENLSLLMSAINNTSQIYASTYTFPDGSTMTGDFDFNYSQSGETAEGVTFEMTATSSGEVTFTAGTP